MNNPTLDLPLEIGNAGDLETNLTGWIIGFSDWSKDGRRNLRHVPTSNPLAGLCVKWFSHAQGDPNGQEKPISTGRTVSILVSDDSEFQLDFSDANTFVPSRTQTYVLRRKGDFVIWGDGVHHRAFGRLPATILTIRWEQSKQHQTTQ